MMQHNCSSAGRRAALRSCPGGGGSATAGTSILAAAAAVALVVLLGCHAAPAARAGNAFAPTAADKAAEARLAASEAMPHLQPFDEHLGAELVSAD